MDQTADSGMCVMFGRRVPRWRAAAADALATGGECRITDPFWWLYPQRRWTSNACKCRQREARRLGNSALPGFRVTPAAVLRDD